MKKLLIVVSYCAFGQCGADEIMKDGISYSGVYIANDTTDGVLSLSMSRTPPIAVVLMVAARSGHSVFISKQAKEALELPSTQMGLAVGKTWEELLSFALNFYNGQ